MWFFYIRIVHADESMAPSLFVAVPCGSDKVFTGHVIALLKLERLCRERGIQMDVVYQPGIPIVHHARNILATRFLEHGYDYMLFLDDDVEFNPADVLQLMHHSETSDDCAVIGGIYPYKRYYWDRVRDHVRKGGAPEASPLAGIKYVFRPMEAGAQVGDTGLCEVECIGTGFLLIARRVFTQMIEAGAGSYTSPDHATPYYRFFEVDMSSGGEMVGEDYWFCRRWRELGGKVHALLSAKCAHWGTHAFGKMG